MAFLHGARFLWAGNSQSTTDYSSPWWGQNVVDLLAAKGYVTSLANTSVSGQTTTNILANLSGNTANGMQVNHIVGRNNIAIVQEATNHLYFLDQTTPDRIAQSLQEIRNACQFFKTSGYRVVVISSIPRLNGYPPGAANVALYQSDMLALDRAIEGKTQEFADLFWDVRKAVPEYDPSSTVYSVDTVHQSQWGHAIMGSRFASFLIDHWG